MYGKVPGVSGKEEEEGEPRPGTDPTVARQPASPKEAKAEQGRMAPVPAQLSTRTGLRDAALHPR